MGYERYPRGTNPQGDYYGRTEPQDYGHDYGSGSYDSYSSARDYQAAGEAGSQGRRGYGQRDYGQRDYGNQRYAQRDAQYGNRSVGGGYQGDGGRGDRDYRDQGSRYGASAEYHGSYASDGRRFEDVGRYRHADDDNYKRGGGNDRGRSYGAQPQGYDYQDRGFFQRAGDEVRSWFGDDDAERRREQDARYDERYQGRDFARDQGAHRDHDYHSWRSGQIAALDRDYDEYRRENRTKFENEFSSWRTQRQGQRDQLGKVTEHMDVVGSDGEHVGTVDKVRGDHVLLTKNDADAGGRHHAIPSRWVQSVDGKVTLSKTAAEAKQQWQEEGSNQAMFRYGDNTDQNRSDQNRSDHNRGTSSYSSGTATSTAKTY